MTFSSDKRTQKIISQEGGGEKNKSFSLFFFLFFSPLFEIELDQETEFMSFCFSLSHDLDAPQRHRWTNIQISEKLSAFQNKTKTKKARGERKLFIPSSLHCYLDIFCCHHISKNIILSASANIQKMFSLCR